MTRPAPPCSAPRSGGCWWWNPLRVARRARRGASNTSGPASGLGALRTRPARAMRLGLAEGAHAPHLDAPSLVAGGPAPAGSGRSAPVPGGTRAALPARAGPGEGRDAPAASGARPVVAPPALHTASAGLSISEPLSMPVRTFGRRPRSSLAPSARPARAPSARGGAAGRRAHGVGPGPHTAGGVRAGGSVRAPAHRRLRSRDR